MRVSVIVAHPDDIEFGAAGTIVKWVDDGAEVQYCLVTDGSAGSNEVGIDLKALIERRREEQIAAAAVLGVQDVIFLGYRDGALQATLDLRRDLTRVIRAFKPDIVLTNDPSVMFVDAFGYINHPDHRAAGEAAVYATFPSAETRPIFPELLDEGLEPHKVGELYLMLTEKPNTFVDVTDVIERKMDSLRCHASQISEDDIEMVRGWEREIGKQAGFEYAEIFRVIKLQQAPPKIVEEPEDAQVSS